MVNKKTLMTNSTVVPNNQNIISTSCDGFNNCIQASVRYFGKEIRKFFFTERSTLPDIFAYIRSNLSDIVGLVTITIRDIAEGSLFRHRMVLGKSSKVESLPKQLSLF